MKGTAMIHQVVTQVSLESFKERSVGKKVVLLYPWTNYRNLFLSHFLASQKEGLLYYCISQDRTVLHDWLTDLANQLDEVMGGFGSTIRSLPESASPEEHGEALAADLGAYSDDGVTLFVDELDHLTFDDTFDRFIRAAVASLPSGAQLAFSSRLLTHQPWYDMVAAGDAVVLGTEYRKNDIMFTVESEIKPQLEVYAFGRGHALVNGQEITNWDGALPRNLFFFFIDKPLITRDDIFATFWPNLSVKEATNVFHVTKRKISERISLKVEEEGNYELTQYSSGFYMPSDKIVRHYDVEDFQEAVERATITLDERERETLYRRAVDLYKAPFLETISMPWVDDRRQHLRQLYAQALIGMGRIAKAQGKLEESLGFFTRALKETPEREDIHREVMHLYLQMDMPGDARKQYETLEKMLQETLDIAPAPETRAIYDSIAS
ncbi:MAG: bacterial transcriptional activator domain-containing protein [Chloroflexota bacterium]